MGKESGRPAKMSSMLSSVEESQICIAPTLTFRVESQCPIGHPNFHLRVPCPGLVPAYSVPSLLLPTPLPVLPPIT